jgi:hypothetical protein
MMPQNGPDVARVVPVTDASVSDTGVMVAVTDVSVSDTGVMVPVTDLAHGHAMHCSRSAVY